tara:strand:- start:2922 stop:3029 length:108 start_codon:yes stop_codon:yes gene_type:complete
MYGAETVILVENFKANIMLTMNWNVQEIAIKKIIV